MRAKRHTLMMVRRHVASASSSMVRWDALRSVRMRCMSRRYLVRVMLLLLLWGRLMHAHRRSVLLLHVHLLPWYCPTMSHRCPRLPARGCAWWHCTMHLRRTTPCHHVWRGDGWVRIDVRRLFWLRWSSSSRCTGAISCICNPRCHPPSPWANSPARASSRSGSPTTM